METQTPPRRRRRRGDSGLPRRQRFIGNHFRSVTQKRLSNDEPLLPARLEKTEGFPAGGTPERKPPRGNSRRTRGSAASLSGAGHQRDSRLRATDQEGAG